MGFIVDVWCIKAMYKKLVAYRSFNVLINGGLGGVVFISETILFKNNFIYAMIIGVCAIFLLSTHTYISQSHLIGKINQSDYWKTKFKRHTWLLDSIRILIGKKIEIFREDGNVPDDFRDKSIKLILQMIYEFYKSCDLSESPQKIRIIYQEPSTGEKRNQEPYLSVKYWYYSDNNNPHYAKDENEERRCFSLNVDPNHPENINLPVKAYHSRKVEVFENSSEIPYHYDGQIQHVKSLISYPVVGEDDKTVLGVITVSSDKDNFFKKNDIPDHEEYLQEFGVRVAMELTAKKRG